MPVKWNPFMLEAHATLKVGSTIHFLEMLQDFGEHWIKAKFQVFQAQTHLIHNHQHTGLLVPYLAKRGVFQRSYQGYIHFNEALKQQCETLVNNR